MTKKDREYITHIRKSYCEFQGNMMVDEYVAENVDIDRYKVDAKKNYIHEDRFTSEDWWWLYDCAKRSERDTHELFVEVKRDIRELKRNAKLNKENFIREMQEKNDRIKFLENENMKKIIDEVF